MNGTEEEPGAEALRRPQRYSTVAGTDDVDFGGGIRITPALTREAGRSMSAYTAYFSAGARANLPAAYEEVWVVLSGSLRVGAGSEVVTVRAGELVLVPEQAPGVVEALDDTTMVCVSVPSH